MKHSDRDLGMHRPITRRDLLHGIGALTAGAMAPGALFAGLGPASHNKLGYPPALTGMRGNHQGSFEVAHQLGREGRSDWGKVQHPDAGDYDLVVVGAGISGLAAAHYYRKEKPDARILILDNHDDFGGHAKRNEFQVDGRTLIGYGGSETLQEPSDYSRIVKDFLRELGVEVKRFDQAFDQGFFKRHGLTHRLHFNQESWGVDRTVSFKAVAKMPISEAAKKQLIRLYSSYEDQIPEIPVEKKREYLSSISYREFLSKHMGITEPEVFALLQDQTEDLGLGIEATPAYRALNYAELPGWDAAGLPDDEDDFEAYIHHFPDGNASIARLLVRQLIPAVAPGNSMEDIVTARFDYAKLDQASSPVRLRLNSTVIRVQHQGEPKAAKSVLISYVRDSQTFAVRARDCVLACNNSIIPYLCPELPAAQREALASQVKMSILHTNVALSNWRAWKKMGIRSVNSPGSYHIYSGLDYPVSLGDYAYSASPDEPVLVRMFRFPHVNNQGLTARQQHRSGRHELMATSFETIERKVRIQLSSILGEAGFDPAADIKGITVNRWAHGYAYWYNPLFDPIYDDWTDERYPHMKARKRFGRISIANADADSNAMLESAVEQAHRAVSELL